MRRIKIYEILGEISNVAVISHSITNAVEINVTSMDVRWQQDKIFSIAYSESAEPEWEVYYERRRNILCRLFAGRCYCYS